MDLTQHELVTLLGALLSAFTISRREGAAGHDFPVPWYETNPYVITMLKPFPCDIKVRSEAKRRWIMSESEDAGYTVKASEAERTDRWDIVRPEGEEKIYTWEGLTTPFKKPNKIPVYPPGV